VLRRARASDAAAFVRLFEEASTYGGTMQLPYPSEGLWTPRLADPPAGSVDLHLVAVREDGRIVASAGLHGMPQVRRRHVAGLGIAVAAEAQGQRVGTALMAALCDWADRWTQILRIELTVFTDNTRAIALYRRFGFVEEGVHRGYAIRDGRFTDVLAMARWHPTGGCAGHPAA
jgi:putative acetyltransferase